MNILANIRQLIKLKLNLRKTVSFNFRVFPPKVAIYFPVLLFGKIQYQVKRGCIVIDTKRKTDIFRIGASYGFFGTKPHRYTCYSNIGKHVLKGRCDVENGGIVRVRENAVLTTGNYVKFGANVRVQCASSITISDLVRFSWDCQLFDTDFHYILKQGGIIKKNTLPVFIGNNVWVGNHVSIMKGSMVPSYSVVSSQTLVNKQFSSESVIIGGIPAKVIGEGTRLFIEDYSGEGDKQLDLLFAENDVSEVLYNSDLVNNYLRKYRYFKQ